MHALQNVVLANMRVDALEGELIASRYGAAVRLEIAQDCPPELNDFLLDMFGLEEEDTYRVDGPVNLNRLVSVYDPVQRPDLKYPSFTPSVPRAIVEGDDILAAMKRGDILLHHPYESFGPVLEFIGSSAKDPDVLSIKVTLYRTGQESPIVDGLVAAAQAGKEVTVIIELRARFEVVQRTLDEADQVMASVLERPLSSYLTRTEGTDEGEAFADLMRTEVLQPAMLAADEALRRLLVSVVEPQVVLGHSLGEYGACVASGVIRFADALPTRLASARSL